MDHFQRLFPFGRAAWLREQIVAAISEAYDENCRRFVEEIGDNATTFGVNLFHNICFFLEQRLGEAADIQVLRPRNSFVIEIDGFSIHVYKAPPDVHSIYGMRFDQSEIRLELVAQNTAQLSLKFEEDAATRLEAQHLVVVHFGDPLDGLDRVEIGAPMASGVNGITWDWTDSLTDPAVDETSVSSERDLSSESVTDLPDFGLQLIDDDEEEQAGESGSAS
jgi:hypothetical protein